MRGVIRALARRLALRPIPRNEAAPLALLLLALSSVFVFGTTARSSTGRGTTTTYRPIR